MTTNKTDSEIKEKWKNFEYDEFEKLSAGDSIDDANERAAIRLWHEAEKERDAYYNKGMCGKHPEWALMMCGRCIDEHDKKQQKPAPKYDKPTIKEIARLEKKAEQRGYERACNTFQPNGITLSIKEAEQRGYERGIEDERGVWILSGISSDRKCKLSYEKGRAEGIDDLTKKLLEKPMNDDEYSWERFVRADNGKPYWVLTVTENRLKQQIKAAARRSESAGTASGSDSDLQAQATKNRGDGIPAPEKPYVCDECGEDHDWTKPPEKPKSARRSDKKGGKP